MRRAGICYPNICHFGIRIVLSWKHLRNSRDRKSCKNREWVALLWKIQHVRRKFPFVEMSSHITERERLLITLNQQNRHHPESACRTFYTTLMLHTVPSHLLILASYSRSATSLSFVQPLLHRQWRYFVSLLILYKIPNSGSLFEPIFFFCELLCV